MKRRFTFIDDGDIILMDDFDLPVPAQRVVEPEMWPENKVQSEEVLFEDAQEVPEQFEEEAVVQEPPQPRRTARANAGKATMITI